VGKVSTGDQSQDGPGGETGSVESPKIFVNYRREDTAGQALHLYDRLKEHFGAEKLFVDVVNLKEQAGLPWLRAIKEEIASEGGLPGVFLVLIGPRWMESMINRFQAKDASPVEDNVIREIEFALDNGSGVVVIPVLVDTAAPGAHEWNRLPKSVRRLAPLQVAPLRHGDFDADVAALIRLIEDKAQARQQSEPEEVDSPTVQPAGEERASWANPEQPFRLPTGGGEFPSAPSPDARHIGAVLRMLTEGSVVPVLGARVNGTDAERDRQAGGGFPDADELASDLARRVGLPVGSEPLDLAEVAELVYMTSGEADLYDWLGQILAVQSEPSPVHRFLAGLPGQLEKLHLPKRYQMIITTNYDTALEQAFDDANEDFDLAVYVASGQFDNRPRFVHYPFDAAPETVTNPNVYYSFPFEGLVLQRTLIVKIRRRSGCQPRQSRLDRKLCHHSGSLHRLPERRPSHRTHSDSDPPETAKKSLSLPWLHDERLAAARIPQAHLEGGPVRCNLMGHRTGAGRCRERFLEALRRRFLCYPTGRLRPPVE
jgi:hypothetical protein